MRMIIGFVLGLCVTAMAQSIAADNIGVIMVARSPSGKAVVIQADENGFVVCSGAAR